MKATVWGLIAGIAILCVFGGVFLYWYRVEEDERVGKKIGANVTAETFTHELFDQVLQTYVDDKGKVDYAALKANPQKLEAYLDQIAVVSPEDLQSRSAQLALWINAYNALTIKGVIDHYPATSVKKIKPLSAFFYRLKFQVGGQSYTLNDIEHGVIRTKFVEPRIHFVLVCASGGCPTLENRAFFPDELEERLENAAFNFINNPYKARLDRQRRILYLSKIFEWYAEDFEETHGGVLDFIMEYLPKEHVDFLRNEDIQIRYFAYDWSLNDQKQR